jgi:hypothetical protein
VGFVSLAGACGDCTGAAGQVIDDGDDPPPLPRQVFLAGCVEDIEVPVAGAIVTIEGSSLTTQTASNGNFTLDITSLTPGQTRTVRATSGSAVGTMTFQVPPAGNVRTTVTLGECIFIEPPPAQQQLVTGKVVAPDGVTPIAGAEVTIPDTFDYPNVFTQGDGTFVLDLTGLPLPPPQSPFQVTKGAFTGSKTVNLDAITPVAGVRDIGTIQLRPPQIAVVTGVFDRMQDILAKTGLGDVDSNGQLVLGSEEFDIYDGDDGVTLGSQAGDYPDFARLFDDDDEDDEENIYAYDIVFINCGVEQLVVDGSVTIRNEPSALDFGVLGTLRGWVNDGGVLYCTDLAYDFVEQPFPEFIDFFGSNATAASDRETPGAAEAGFGRNPGETPAVSTNATVLDSLLAGFLDAVTCRTGACRNTNGTVFITGFAPSWAVMNGPHSGVPLKTWVQGPVAVIDSATSVRPLTASFAHGHGTVHFSSYHTEEDNPSTGFTPQERILQFLVFETIFVPED